MEGTAGADGTACHTRTHLFIPFQTEHTRTSPTKEAGDCRPEDSLWVDRRRGGRLLGLELLETVGSQLLQEEA